MILVMVRIPIGSAEEGSRLEERFRNRAGAVDSMPGFKGFELLKGEHEYISVTRWATRADLDRWMSSQAHAHAHADARPTAPTSGGHPHAEDAATQTRSNVPASSTLVYEVVIPSAEE